jgi:hypothetical protein
MGGSYNHQDKQIRQQNKNEGKTNKKRKNTKKNMAILCRDGGGCISIIRAALSLYIV